MLVFKENLKKLGLTHQDIANILHKERSTITKKIISNNFTLEEVKTICEALNKNYYELFTNEEE